jgi:3-isopropylmalate/(R)-2-methylmalate dehydratase small subunit
LDLDAQTLTTPSGTVHDFQVDAFKKYCLLNGLDEIGLTRQHLQEIRDYEQRRRREAPWLFPE